MGADDFYLVGSRDYAAHDIQWLKDRMRAEEFQDVSVEDISDEVDIIHIAGPRSHALMGELLEEPFKLPFMRVVEKRIGGVAVNIFRISFSGELGFELHTPTAAAGDILRMVLAAGEPLGVRLFGGYALNALRVDRGFKLKGDLDYAHYTEAGIDFFCKSDKDFLGKGTADLTCAPTRQAALFSLATSPSYRWSIPSDCPIFRNDEVIGFTTSSSYSLTLEQTVALGYLTTDVAATDEIFCEAFGERWPAAILPEPPLKCVTSATGIFSQSAILTEPAVQVAAST